MDENTADPERDPVAHRVGRLQREFASQVQAMTPEVKRQRGITDDSPRVWAIEQVARERGITSQSVRTMLKRSFTHKKKLEQLERDYKNRKLQKLEDFDLELEPDWLSGVELIQDELHIAEWHLKQARRVVAVLKRSEWYPDAEAKRLGVAIAQAGMALEAAKPASVCPYCKQTEGVIAECAPCYGLGLIVEHQRADVPKQFWATQAMTVLHRGEEKPRSAFEPELEQGEMFE